MSWRFKAGSVEPFLRFLWQECTTEKGPDHPYIRAATFVEVLGGQPTSLREREPLAVIAMDATYCEDGTVDEFFNMAALVLLNNLKIALILTWAFEITENEAGRWFQPVLTYASEIFESPACTWKPDPLPTAWVASPQLDDVAEWFGFDMRKVGSFEDRQELLEKIPGMTKVIESSPFRDLEDFAELMHNLRPNDVPQHPADEKKAASFLEVRMHGEGRYEWPDGRAYEGQYMNDLKEGEGTFLWADERKFTGQWKDGKQHGVGVFRSAHGEQRTGEWREGVRVCWVDEAPNNVPVRCLVQHVQIHDA
eukprot:s614_g9.t1